MTTFLLIRHAHVEVLGGSLAGRRAGVHLTEQGRREAQTLAQWLARETIDRVYSSPLERAQETAAALAAPRRLAVEPAEELIDFEFGEWTERSFAELERDPRWRQFNTVRSGVRVPGGETMLEVQARAVGLIQRLHDAYPQQTLALVSHYDVIRAVLCYYLGMPLDLFHRLSIAPASLTTLRLDNHHPILLTLNAAPPLPGAESA